jgi:adenylate cyclase
METTLCPHGLDRVAEACEACREATAQERGAGMRCRECGRAMPDDSRFCSTCGASLVTDAAPHATSKGSLAAEASFPVSVGEIPGERKPVTILFVNASGSLDLSASFDPEQWHTILSRFFDILGAGVRRHGGVVERLTGEGIKARFGAPVAHERHALQACEAALALASELAAFGQQLRRDHGVSFSARMGIHSGEALYGPVGASGAMTSSAQGYTAALAARMEQLAEPGTIYLTDQTARLVRDYFELDDLGAFTIRGLREPLRVHQLLGRGSHQSRIDAAHARGFTRFVGRGPELERLVQVFGAARREGGLKVVGIVGEAGIGKSRLAEEFARYCEAQGASVGRFQSLERERLIPFGFARRFARTMLGIRDDDDPQTAREKAAGRLVLLDPDLRDALAVTFDLLGVASGEAKPAAGHAARVKQITAMFNRLLDRQGQDAPLVLVLDDRHWTDDATELVTQAFDEEFKGSMVAVMVYRPNYHRSWMLRAEYPEIALRPLSEAECSDLVEAFLGHDVSVAGVAREVVERSGGNPFFLEELLRALVDGRRLIGSPGAYRLNAAASTDALPDNLRALLSARIDALPAREKLVVQTAAVIGMRFAAPVLRRAVELPESEVRASLDELARADLVTPNADAAPGGFHFRHPLMAESAERSLLRDHRAHLHARVAQAISAEHGAFVDAHAAEIAEHWEKAGQLLEAASWHRRAAVWASRRDPRRALAHWRALRSFAPRLADAPSYQEHLLAACIAELELGWHQGISREEGAALYEMGNPIARDAGDLASLARITASWGEILSICGDLGQALRKGKEACAIAETSRDVGLEHSMRSRLVSTLFETGDLPATIEACSTPYTYLEPSMKPPPIMYDAAIHLRIMRGVALLDFGELTRGREELARALEVARLQNDRFCICIGTSMMASVPRLTGHLPADLLARSREAVALADVSGSRLLQVAARAGLGVVAHYAGLAEEGRRVLESTLGLLGSGGVAFHNEPQLHSLLGPVCLSCGDPEAAIAHAQRGLDSLRDGGRPLREVDAILRWSRVAVTIGTIPTARSPRSSSARSRSSRKRRPTAAPRACTFSSGSRTWRATTDLARSRRSSGPPSCSPDSARTAS